MCFLDKRKKDPRVKVRRKVLKYCSKKTNVMKINILSPFFNSNFITHSHHNPPINRKL